MGSIYDRRHEHLGYSDKTIIALRKTLLDALTAMRDGKDPPHVLYDPAKTDFSKLRSIKGVLPGGADWHRVMEGVGPNDG
jgi:hypothetical protein